MKSRWIWFWLCIVLGLVLLAVGLLIPAHLRAVDIGVVQAAGKHGGAGLLERGKDLAATGRLGAAELYAPAARLANMPGWDRFGTTVTNLIQSAPAMRFWGNDTHTPSLFPVAGARILTPNGDFAAFIIRADNRQAALAHLEHSTSSAAQEMLHTRNINTLVFFIPSSQAGGQVYDAAIAETGLLLDGGHVTTSLNDDILALALQANRGHGTQPLEDVLSDFVSLGERFNWDQLTAFVANIPNATTLHQLATATRTAGDKLPVLYAAVQLSGDPVAVGKYTAKFSQTGLQDMTPALCYGAEGVKILAEGGQRYYQPTWQYHSPFGGIYYAVALCSLQNRDVMMAVKWFCYLAAGCLFALAMHVGQRPVAVLEQPLQVRGVHLFREFLFSLGFLLIVLLLSEPFLTQGSQEGNTTFRLHLPMAGNAVSAGFAGIQKSIMNPTILLTLLLFFVLQALIYLACILKLAEIRRQNVPPRVKLKLLENEEHLFDAGLYLGFVGTIVSLIVASMGLVKFSLMAAYSSTSFGIIFVVVFKIFHLRRARRQLVLEAEAEAMAVPPPPPRP